MKIFKKIVILTIIAVVIQLGGFLFLEKSYFSPDLHMEVKEDIITQDKVKQEPEFVLDEDVEDVTFSSDGKYIAYMDDGDIKTINTEKQTINTLRKPLDEEQEIVYYKWLYNDSSMIVIKKIKKDDRYYFEPVAFDASRGEEKKLTDFDFKDLLIPINNSKVEKIEDVSFSTASHSLYIKIKKGNNISDLYYANVMNDLKRVLKNRDIGNVVVPITNTNAIYEQGDSIRVLNNYYPIEVPDTKNPIILGTDSDANVYIGDVVDDKIKSIHYKDFSSESSLWNNIEIKMPISKEDIFVDYSGNVYFIDREQKVATELKTNKEIDYKGEFVQTYNKGIISIDDNVVKKNKLK